MLHEPLPQNHCLKNWFAAKQTYTLQNHACDPDRWRLSSNAQYDPDEAPRHYLDVDRISPPQSYPREWDEVLRVFTKYAVGNGRVPWRVEEYYGKLVKAFEARDTSAILDITCVMSHYVTDSFSILHNTSNFNPGGKLHSRWETDMLNVESQLNEISSESRRYFGAPGTLDARYAIFDMVLVGNSLVPSLIQANDKYPTDEAAFYREVKEMTARRWGDALTLLSSLVWSAWAQAGVPSLEGFENACSLSRPTQQLSLIGYPPPGGFTPSDAGVPQFDGGIIVLDGGDGKADAGCLDGCMDSDADVDSGSDARTHVAKDGATGTSFQRPPLDSGEDRSCSVTPELFALGVVVWGLKRLRRRTSCE
jgi:hypothetical protein